MPPEQDQAKQPAPPPAAEPRALGQVTKTAAKKAGLAGLLAGAMLGLMALLATMYLGLSPVDDWLGQLVGGTNSARIWFVFEFAVAGFVMAGVLEFVVQWVAGMLGSKHPPAPPKS